MAGRVPSMTGAVASVGDLRTTSAATLYGTTKLALGRPEATRARRVECVLGQIFHLGPANTQTSWWPR
jgi:hypothetical protein